MLTKRAVRQGASNPWPRVQFGPANPRHVAKEERDVNFYFEPQASIYFICWIDCVWYNLVCDFQFYDSYSSYLQQKLPSKISLVILYSNIKHWHDHPIKRLGGGQQWWPPAHLGLTPLQFNHSARRWQWHNNGLLILSSLSPIGRSRSQQTSGEVRLDPGLFSSPPTGHR